MNRLAFFVLATLVASAAAAQSRAGPDPRDPKAPAPHIAYRSVFDDYRRFQDAELASWREVNDEMARLGGHQGHAAPPARENPQAAKAPAEAPKRKAQHGGHK